MRMSIRPGYVVRRSFHFAGVKFTVWRRNRSTARAFYDPLVDGGFPFLPSVIRRSHIRKLILFLFVAVIAATVAAGYRYVSRHPLAELAALRAVPGLQVPSSLAAPPSPLPMASIPAKASAPILPAEPEAAPALAPVAAEPPEAKIPRISGNASYLLACKRDRTLYVYHRADTHWEKQAAFPMAIGRAPGDKSDAGDMRTPEGRFWITGLVSGPSKGAMYGPLVFTLNYPRPGDEAEGKTGQGIWIHGVDAGKLPSYTHGCLSLANEDVLALSAYADIGTPLLILPDSLAPDPAKQMDLAGLDREYPSILSAYGRKTHADTLAREKALKQAADYVAKEAKDFPELAMQTLSPQDKKAVLARLQRWREDWSSRNIEAYAANYDSDFRDREGRGKESFVERKARIFESKSKIQMEIIEPQIESEGYSRVKVSFRQDYLAEGPQGPQRSSGPKTLRMESGPAGWLIITE
ncbi:MAG: ErfK/YbiS/YcfS/YnhG family protein [Fibrobacteres bacterium]|nr:ErfK/YbiS/YcfS/YnhG family protein [Fibrobacterota bacterium]